MNADDLEQAIDDLLSDDPKPVPDIAQALLEQRFLNGYKDWKSTERQHLGMFFVTLGQCVQRRHYPGSVFKASLGVAQRVVAGYDMVGQDAQTAAAFVALCTVVANEVKALGP